MSDPLNEIKEKINQVLTVQIPSLLAAATKTAQEEMLWQLPETDKRFALTDYIIEGNAFDIWEKYSNQSMYKTPLNKYYFEQDREGTLPTVGTFGSESVTICCSWNLINGYFCLFYEPISNVINRKMIEKWLSKRCNDKEPQEINTVLRVVGESRGRWKNLEEIRREVNKYDY